jgi:hypothetical protein
MQKILKWTFSQSAHPEAEARDKVGRIVQYFCRFLQGANQNGSARSNAIETLHISEL